MEDEVQRPDGNAQHDQHVRQRPELHVNLVGNNRHGNQQAITDQPAQHAEPHRPVFGALIRNGEGAKVRHARAEDQPQEGFKELNQGKGIEEQSLLKRDGFVSGIKSVGQHLADKQRQGQQQQIDDKRPGNHCRKMQPAAFMLILFASPLAHFPVKRPDRQAQQPVKNEDGAGQNSKLGGGCGKGVRIKRLM